MPEVAGQVNFFDGFPVRRGTYSEEMRNGKKFPKVFYNVKTGKATQFICFSTKRLLDKMATNHLSPAYEPY